MKIAGMHVSNFIRVPEYIHIPFQCSSVQLALAAWTASGGYAVMAASQIQGASLQLLYWCSRRIVCWFGSAGIAASICLVREAGNRFRGDFDTEFVQKLVLGGLH